MPVIRFALILAIIVTSLSSPLLYAQDSPDVVPIIIALEFLPRGLLLTEEMVIGTNPKVGLVFYPADSLPATGVQSFEQLIGRVLRTDIEVEQPLATHYFFPHPAEQPLAEIPYPISPQGYTVVRDYGLYQELSLSDLETVIAPAGLAAGDRVDVVSTTTLGDITLDETRIILQGVMVARVTEDAITLSLTADESERLSPIVLTGQPLTLMLHSFYMPPDAPPINFNVGANAINWTYLAARDENPLLIPAEANLDTLERNE